MPRKLVLNSQAILSASGAFMSVSRKAQGRGIATQLIERYLDGPQDISVVDRANDDFTRLFLKSGGKADFVNSLSWKYPLRPSLYAMTLAARRSSLIRNTKLLYKPAAALLDSFMPVKRSFSEYRCETVDTEEFSTLAGQISCENVVSVEPGQISGNWLMGLLQEGCSAGDIHLKVVQDTSEVPVGWCLYGIREGIAEILDVGFMEGREQETFFTLCSSLRQEGVAALSGRVFPSFFATLSNSGAFMKAGPSRVLFHTRDTLLQEQFTSGKTGFSRLAGEWWIEFPKSY